MVTLTVGNAYLLVISDAARIRSVQSASGYFKSFAGSGSCKP